MRVARTSTITVTREAYFAEGIPGHYLIDCEGRWYEVSYVPFTHDTTNRRVQIEYTDLHEKAVDAIEADARNRREQHA